MHAMRELFPFLARYRRRLVLTLAGMALFAVLGLLPPLLMRYLIDRVVQPGLWQLLTPTVMAIVLVPLLSEGIRFWNVRALMAVGQRFIADIRLAMYTRVLNLSLRYHGEHAAGAIVSRIMDDVNMVLRLLTEDTVRIIVDILILLISLSVAFTIEWRLALILCGVLLLYGLAYLLFSRRIREHTRSYRRIYDEIAGRLQETVTGVRQVRIYNREDWENGVFQHRMAEGVKRALATSMGTVNLGTACGAISGFGSTLIWGLAGYMVLAGRITYGDLLAFNAYVWMAMSPVVRLTAMAGQMVETGVSIDRIAEILREQPDIVSRPGAPRLAPGPGAVDFDRVTFGYGSGAPLYRDLSLHVDPGQTVALVGPTGCGKTSLLLLLMRYWDIQGGAVRIDGADVREVDLADLRGSFGVVLQDPVVFDGTFAENIAYGRPAAARAEIESAARAAEIYDLAMAHPDGLDTLIGKRGIKLSVGEKQRLSIARAILKDPRILVMDEATSSLDSHSEALIQKALTRVLAGRTCFVVAHRLSTITAADKIVVMKAGRVVQEGTHTELIAAGGLYRKLYNQLRGDAAGGEVS